MKSDLKDFLQTFAAEGKVSVIPHEYINYHYLLAHDA